MLIATPVYGGLSVGYRYNKSNAVVILPPDEDTSVLDDSTYSFLANGTWYSDGTNLKINETQPQTISIDGMMGTKNITLGGDGSYIKNLHGLEIAYLGVGKHWVFKYSDAIAPSTGMNLDEALGRVNILDVVDDTKGYLDSAGNFWAKGDYLADGVLITNGSSDNQMVGNLNVEGNLRVPKANITTLEATTIKPILQPTPSGRLTLDDSIYVDDCLDIGGNLINGCGSKATFTIGASSGVPVTDDSIYTNADVYFSDERAKLPDLWKNTYINLTNEVFKYNGWFIPLYLNVSRELNVEDNATFDECINLNDEWKCNWDEIASGGSSVSVYTQEYEFFDHDQLPNTNSLEVADNQVAIGTGLPIRQNGTIIAIAHNNLDSGTCVTPRHCWLTLTDNADSETAYTTTNITIGSNGNTTNYNSGSYADAYQNDWKSLEVGVGYSMDMKCDVGSCSSQPTEHVFSVIVKTNSSVIS